MYSVSQCPTAKGNFTLLELLLAISMSIQIFHTWGAVSFVMLLRFSVLPLFYLLLLTSQINKSITLAQAHYHDKFSWFKNVLICFRLFLPTTSRLCLTPKRLNLNLNLSSSVTSSVFCFTYFVMFFYKAVRLHILNEYLND